MPTYDYKCENCGHTFELFQSMKDDPIHLCPSCGEEAVKRLIGAGAGLVFKGSGFYLTDYVKNGNGKVAASSSSSESSTSGSSGDATASSSNSSDSSSGGSAQGSGATGTTASGGDSTKAA